MCHRGVLPWVAEEAQGFSPLHQPTPEWATAWEKCQQQEPPPVPLPCRDVEEQRSAVQPYARIRPQQRGSPNFPLLRRVQVLFSADGPWAPRGQQGCACHRRIKGRECLSCWQASRGWSSVEEHPLRMWEVLGSVPGISRGGAFALTAQPQAAVGWSSGTAPPQALWA